MIIFTIFLGNKNPGPADHTLRGRSISIVGTLPTSVTCDNRKQFSSQGDESALFSEWNVYGMEQLMVLESTSLITCICKFYIITNQFLE